MRITTRVGLITVLAAALGACTSVDQTEHCVGTRYGKVVEPKMDNGINATIFETANCFSLTDQNFPGAAHEKETMEAQTKDPMTIQGDVAIVYAFDPASINAVFLEKRSQAAAEVQILNAIRAGFRGALSSWTVNDIFSGKRATLGDSVRAHIQSELGNLAIIKQVYVRDIRVPEAIEAARIAATKQQLVFDQAQKQLAIDSMNARGTVIKAQAQADANLR